MTDEPPRGKSRRWRLDADGDAVRRLWSLLYRTVRRQATRVDALTRAVAELQAEVVRLRSDLTVAHGLAAGALAAHHDAHRSVTDEHVRPPS